MRLSFPLWLSLLLSTAPVLEADTVDATCESEELTSNQENTTSPAPAPAPTQTYKHRRPKHCQDLINHCHTRIEEDSSACFNDFHFMGDNCAKACRICSTADPNPKTIANHKKGTADRIFAAVPQNIEGESSVDTWLHLRQTEEYMYNTVYVDPQFDQVRKDCQLRHENCLYWATLGECTKNKNYMTTTCAPACQSCLMVKFENRCPLDTSGPHALAQPGDMYNMFERILTNMQFTKYEPKALSRPSNNTVDDAPWLIVLENVLSPEECQTMIEQGAQRGYKPSSEVGSTLRHDGRRESMRSDRRTSSTTWCKKECAKHPVAITIHERLEALTGITQQNYEYLQMLK